MFKFYLLSFICGLFPLLPVAQTASAELLLQHINEQQALRLQHIFTDSRDSIFTEFENRFTQLIRHPDFCNTPIDTTYHYFLNGDDIPNQIGKTLAYSFMNRIVWVTSPDSKIRVFSWDNLSGGSYHSYTSWLQWKTEEGACQWMALDTSWNDWEVGYYKIYPVPEAGRQFYLLMNYGTPGSGKQHYGVRIFELKDDQLTECLPCYPEEGQGIRIGSNRSQDVQIRFDPTEQSLRYKAFTFDDEIGFYRRDFVWVKWYFKAGKFTKSVQKD